MAWVRIDDHFDEHPKIAAAGPLGLALFVAGLAYSNRNLTDGFIPTPVARRLLDWTVRDRDGNEADLAVTVGAAGYDVDSEMVIDTLLHTGLWGSEKGGYRVHDYTDYQPTKTQVLAEREAARERMRKHRDSRGSPEQTENFKRSSGEVQGPRTRTQDKNGEQNREVAAPQSDIDLAAVVPIRDGPAARKTSNTALPGNLDSVELGHAFRLVSAIREEHRDERTATVVCSFAGKLPPAAFETVREKLLEGRRRIKNDAKYAVGELTRMTKERTT